MNARKNIRRSNIPRRLRGKNTRIKLLTNARYIGTRPRGRKMFNRKRRIYTRPPQYNRNNNNNPMPMRSRNNNTNKKVEKQMNEVINKLDNMSIKSTNLQTQKKEVRTDRLMSPYTMARRSQFIPIYEIKEKVLHLSTYTKITLNFDGAGDQIQYSMLFFPYSVNFRPHLYEVYSNPVMVSGGRANHFKNIYFLADNLTAGTTTATYLETADTGIIGNWKLIGTSIKIYNTSSMINKAGDFSIIKIQANELVPCFVHDYNSPDASLTVAIKNFVNRDYYQAPRNNFSANDTVFIDEYNVSNGTNIFNSPEEYMGSRYLSQPNNNVALFNADYVGNNIIYLFQAKNVATSQTYVFEIWNVFSVIPAPNSGLGNLGTVSKRCFNKEVVDSIKDRPNMYKANK